MFDINKQSCYAYNIHRKITKDFKMVEGYKYRMNKAINGLKRFEGLKQLEA